MPKHYIRTFQHFPGSYAMLAEPGLGRRYAMVFVHGFIGNAVTTWVQFQHLIDELQSEYPWWANYDLYFYDYDTLSGSNTAVLAQNFRKFLGVVFPRPHRLALSPPSSALVEAILPDVFIHEIEPPECYDHLVIVGHSLGAVVIRQALVDIAINSVSEEFLADRKIDPDERDRLQAQVRLFAPAIYGFNPTSLPGFLYHFAKGIPILNHFLQPVLLSNATHEELQPESRRLRDLRGRTQQFAGDYPWMQAMRARIAFGEHDHIVELDRYDCDPVMEIVQGQDHVSICKPKNDYRLPLEFVGYERSKPISV